MKKIETLISDSVQGLKKSNMITICALMAGIAIVFGYMATIEIGPFIKIGFSEIPNRIVEFLFGPVIGGIFGGTLDIFKFIVKPTGIFFPGFTINSILSGIIYGIFLYKKPVKLYRIVITEFLVKAIVNCGLNTLWLSILYGKAFVVILPVRVIKNLVMWPIDSIILIVILRCMEKVIKPIIISKG